MKEFEQKKKVKTIKASNNAKTTRPGNKKTSCKPKKPDYKNSTGEEKED